MATSVCSKNETSCQEESVVANIVDKNKKDNYDNRAAFYKKPIKKDNVKLELDFNDTPQEIRRQRILYYQKKNRDEAVNARRGLLEDVFNSENEEEMEAEEVSQEMEVEPIKKKFYRLNKLYANLVMYSEWMLEVPKDFAEKWIMVPCPVGKRSLVVAHKGKTVLYTKRGNMMKEFKSALPGGNSKHCKRSCTILDGLWDEEKGVFYILDVLTWSMQEMLDCEAEFRFFWIMSRIEDSTEFKEIREGYNECKFELLPHVPCDRDLYDSLESIVESITLDGLLFFHKEVHYASGRTPLVVWLKPYMLPEVLGMSVPAPYDEKPTSYIDFEHHVLRVIQREKEKIEKKQLRNKRQSKSEQEDME